MNRPDIDAVLGRCGIGADQRRGGALAVRSPIDGAELARLHDTPLAAMPGIVARARAAFLAWRDVPAPARGHGRSPRRARSATSSCARGRP